MRDRWKWVAAASLAVGAIGIVGSAEAGNVASGASEYYSVIMTPGDYLSYTGSPQTHTILVDDITYATQINPCNTATRCMIFTSEDFGQYDSNSTQLDPLRYIINGQEVTVGFTFTMVSAARTSIARGQYMAAYLIESNGTNNIRFDETSHSVWAQLVAKSKRERTTWNFGDVAFPDGVGATVSVAEALSITSWAVPTSESRHYQTPHIVQDGGRVTFSLDAAWAAYANARCFVKGRIFFGGGPTENTSVTVQAGP